MAKAMDYLIQASYKAVVEFEISVDVDGNSYLVIYGRHINGGFCAIPNWGISCEAGEPNDTFYNTERLERAGLSYEAAKAISAAICGYSLRIETNRAVNSPEQPIEAGVMPNFDSL